MTTDWQNWNLKSHEREELEMVAPFVKDDAELAEYLDMYRGTLKAKWMDLGLSYADLGAMLTTNLRMLIERTSQ